MRVIPSRLGAARSERLRLVVLSLFIGGGAGLGAVAFRYLIEGLTRLFSGHEDYAGLGHVANPHVAFLGRYFVVLTPVVAGLLYGPLIYLFAREARGHGVPEVMVAVARNGGRIRPQVAVVKALASALCIGGGGSVGREGPIVQIGSALGSTLGQVCRLGEQRTRLLVACGAAGGIAATFNAPLAGVFFAMEIILREWATESFGMVVLSSVTASVVGRSVLGDNPFLSLPAFRVDHVSQYPLFAVLGLIAGLTGVAFSRVLYAVEDVCDWVWRGPEWARPAVGGLLLGGLLLALPEMYGVGYPVLGRAVAGGYGVAFLVALLVGKLFVCSVTIGIGGSGGVFAPALFCGAMTGAVFGDAAHAIAPDTAGSIGTYALIGMGAVFAGAARAPITAVVILFELTGEYTIILPLMLAIVLAAGVSHFVSHDTVYTRKLLRRGIDIDEPADAALRRRPASDVMTAPPTAVRESLRLEDGAAMFADSAESHLPVADDRGTYLGVLAAVDVINALAAGETTTARSLTTTTTPVTPETPLGVVLHELERGAGAVPVVDSENAITGWIRHRDLLLVLSSGTLPIGASLNAAGPDPGMPAPRSHDDSTAIDRRTTS
ncbi:chloride channel protein, CIC family [Jatrophihabitans endophyticus]|uniref:Chloride channel protein, CIC family n=1 Tax=Jatrophihabitans endophyticus TaxID=1206085 RepID=A0A1M5ISP4_9ACTN|nr:chloride channel protein [Jatrophihabitans endophyticus]SHG30980.1 chloride channel protein, CIC family [Jatrophihabitans endophyticus]